MKKTFDSIESVVADMRRGKMVIVVDDADRENEGDLILAAEFVTPAAVNFMVKHGRGLVCVPTTSERLQQLGIERMVRQNRESFKTDFQVSVDAARQLCPRDSARSGVAFWRILTLPPGIGRSELPLGLAAQQRRPALSPFPDASVACSFHVYGWRSDGFWLGSFR